jgi:hypothetical protein
VAFYAGSPHQSTQLDRPQGEGPDHL